MRIERSWTLALLVPFLAPFLGFAEETTRDYLTPNHVGKNAPELPADPERMAVHAPRDITLASLKGKIVLLLFTSTG